MLRGAAPRLILLGLLTVAVMLSHDLLPERTLRIVPSQDFSPGFYALPDAKGRAGRMLSTSPPSWECDVSPDLDTASPCGFVVDLSDGGAGRDLSAYDSIRVEMSVEGDDKLLRFSLRNFEPGYSKPGEWESEKIENVSVPVDDIKAGLAIGFNEFKVVDWWLMRHPLPRRRVPADFHHVTGFGIDIAPTALPGRHVYTVNKVEFVGGLVSAEHWYRGILWFWIVLAVSAGLVRLFSLLRRQREERHRLALLMRRNADLETEKLHFREMSKRDPLTGLYNRYGVSEWVLGRKAQPDRNEGLSLIVMDIDFFKRINDSFGHEAGDKVLREVSAILAHRTRSSDCAARWGGEEFVLLLPDTSLWAAQHIAEKLRAAVEAAEFPEVGEARVTVSLGVGQSDEDEPLEILFDRVDQALYRAKQAGRNRVEMAPAGSAA